MPDYIIPSDNWEQQQLDVKETAQLYYIIPSDNWEQQHDCHSSDISLIISYQAITGNNNMATKLMKDGEIISYQAITGNNNR